MKIVFVLHSHKAGGAERHLLQLMQSLPNNGVECIYAGPMDGWLGEQVLASSFRHEHIPYLSGVTCERAAATPQDDPLTLPRKAVAWGDSLIGVWWKMHMKNSPKRPPIRRQSEK